MRLSPAAVLQAEGAQGGGGWQWSEAARRGSCGDHHSALTTTGTRGVGRDPAAAVFFLAKKKEGAWTPVPKSNNFFFILVLRQAPQAPVIHTYIHV